MSQSTEDEATEEYIRVKNAARTFFFDEFNGFGKMPTVIEIQEYLKWITTDEVPITTISRWHAHWKRSN